jgi:hypothetical protein
MGWKDAFDYLGSSARQHLGQPAPAQQDRDLPLAARIGSLVTLQQSPLLRASSAGSLIALPGAADSRIVAISQLKLNLAGRLYRYYLATGDDDGHEKFLQVYTNPQGECEVLYCSQLVRVVPESVEEQDLYTGSDGCGLGDLHFTLWRAQLADCGRDEQDLAQVFETEAGLDFQRDCGDDANFVAPFTGSETRLDDAAGQHGLQQLLHFMPYVRPLRDGGKEYLLITTEVIQSVNGDASKRGIHVDFVVGIPVGQERLVIQ